MPAAECQIGEAAAPAGLIRLLRVVQLPPSNLQAIARAPVTRGDEPGRGDRRHHVSPSSSRDRQ